MKSHIQITIDAEEKKKLKVYAVLKEKTITAIILEALTDYLQKQTKQ